MSPEFAAEFTHLLSNNTITSFMDSISQGYITYLGMCRAGSSEQTIRASALGQKKIGPLVNRNFDAIQFMAPIHGIHPTFDKDMVTPEKIVALKQTVWQVRWPRT